MRRRKYVLAITHAMKNVLSPNSVTRIIATELPNALQNGHSSILFATTFGKKPLFVDDDDVTDSSSFDDEKAATTDAELSALLVSN
jgi:hypothetical protein